MNINKLYRYSNTPVSMKKFCKLCEVDLDRLTHIEDCPGVVLESLRYEIHVEGPHCGRGCCGYTNARVEGDSFEAIAEEAVREGSDAISVRYTGSVRAPYGITGWFDASHRRTAQSAKGSCRGR
jgi:hypothetical protein